MSITEKSDVIKSLFSLLEENEKRVDALENKLEIIEQKISGKYRLEKPVNKKSSIVKRPSTRSILVVDDDKKLASSFKLILESSGYVVDVANTGFAAHIKITRNTYDLVILDWHLQDIFGDKIAETIKKQSKDTKIIFITGYSYLLDEFEQEDEILMKPIDPDHLLDTIANTIA